MTNAELKLAFKIYYDAITNFASPGYEDPEINVFLNKAYDTIIEQLYQAGRLDDLIEFLTIVKYDLYTCTAEELGDYSFQVDVDDDFWFYVDSRTKIHTRSFIASGSEFWTSNIITDKVKMAAYATTPSNAPIILHPRVAIYGLRIPGTSTHSHTRIVGLTDKYCVVTKTGGNQAFELSYIRYPDRIDVSAETSLCELAEPYHDKVASLAANIAIQVTEKERMSKQPQQQKQQQ